jgi:2,3-bisphosphoglycerate-independent phosphoglycerate mutase
MTNWSLRKLDGFSGVRGPVVVCVMDGVGCGAHGEGNAVWLARKPNLTFLAKQPAVTQLFAHGTAVGMPSDADMGNSEVGHNAIGAGRIFDQGAKLVEAAIQSGAMFHDKTWLALVSRSVEHSAPMHFIGLLSDGNVHSHIRHLFAMLERCAREGVRVVRVHALLDGRDVPETSAFTYIDALQEQLARFSAAGLDYRIASGGGRMVTTMDRYNADWRVVERGWRAHVLGEARTFQSAREAIETFRREKPGIGDQNLPPFVIADQAGKPVGPIEDGASVVLFNFRGDRGIELTRAFEESDFKEFDRVRHPAVLFAGMMQYDGDLHLPKHFLVSPPVIERTLGEYLVHNGRHQLAISETQKFGHVTYFWNGNRSGMIDPAYETYVEVPSDRVSFSERPFMKAAEITDGLIHQLESGTIGHARLNFANGDMVGHTGDREAAIIAIEAVDLCLGRILPVIERLGGALITTADHGNADEMFELDKAGQPQLSADGRPFPKTSHTLNQVPFYVYAPSLPALAIDPAIAKPRLSNIAGSVLQLMGWAPPDDFDPGLLKLRQ